MFLRTDDRGSSVNREMTCGGTGGLEALGGEQAGAGGWGGRGRPAGKGLLAH